MFNKHDCGKWQVYPTRHIIGHFRDDLTGQMTQPNQQPHGTGGQRLVNQVKHQSHQAQLIKDKKECNKNI